MTTSKLSALRNCVAALREVANGGCNCGWAGNSRNAGSHSDECMSEVAGRALAALDSSGAMAEDEGLVREVYEAAESAHRGKRFVGEPRPNTVTRAALAVLDARLKGETL